LISLFLACDQWFHGAGGGKEFLGNLGWAIFFIPSITSSDVLFPLNVPAWSLLLELIANGFYGLTAARLSFVGLAICVFVFGVVLVVAVAAGRLGFGLFGIGAMADGWEWHSIGAGFARVAFSFFAGILVHRVWMVWRPPFSVPPLLLIFILGAVLAAYPSERFQVAFDLAAALVVFPALIWLGASSAAWGVLVPVFSWLGAASYAVYVLQFPLYYLTMRIATALAGNPESYHFGPFWSVAFVVFVLGVAIIFDRYVDVPVRRMLTKWFVVRGRDQGGRPRP
jgi:peptidoglycan/LPS O-acetylase OafA/YrhL